MPASGGRTSRGTRRVVELRKKAALLSKVLLVELRVPVSTRLVPQIRLSPTFPSSVIEAFQELVRRRKCERVEGSKVPWEVECEASKFCEFV